MGDASLLYRSLFLDANLFSNSSGQIQIKPKVQFQFVPRDTEESECLDLLDFRGVAFSAESVIFACVCECVSV